MPTSSFPDEPEHPVSARKSMTARGMRAMAAVMLQRLETAGR